MSCTVLLAGGGTGGHIYPNVAIAERLQRDMGGAKPPRVHYLVSDRPGDAKIMQRVEASWSASPARPLPSASRPWTAPAFADGFARAVGQLHRLIERERITAVVGTGGFVTGPAIVAAVRSRIPRALVNLDAVPGQANRHLARLCTKVWTTYETEALPAASRIGLPLRAASTMTGTIEQARHELGLAAGPDHRMLFVTGATHGAESVIKTMMALVGSADRAKCFSGWQILHQCGTFDRDTLAHAYADAGVDATVVDYLDAMGAAWGSADLVISRAGAGSVAEAWANAAPTIFLPNPYHKDQHQRHNAQPLVDAGGAVMVDDLIDAERNVGPVGRALFSLMDDAAQRDRMRQALRRSRPPDGAESVARWLAVRA